MIHDPLCYVECKGRDATGSPVLEKPLRVLVEIKCSVNGTTIVIRPKDCPHNTGKMGHICSASGPWVENGTNFQPFCPYAVDVPEGLDVLFIRAREAAVLPIGD